MLKLRVLIELFKNNNDLYSLHSDCLRVTLGIGFCPGASHVNPKLLHLEAK